MERSFAILALAVVAAAPARPARAQPVEDARNVSGLLGKALAPADDLAAAVGDLLLSRKKGTVASATVLDDAERAVLVEVEVAGLEAGKCKVSAQVKDAAGQDVKEIPEASAPVDGPGGKIRLALSLKAGLPEGAIVESARVRVEVRRAGQFKYETARWFALGKRWTSTVRPENVVVEAVPAPVGTIPETAPAVGTVKPRLIRPELLHALALAPAVPPAAAQPAPGSASVPAPALSAPTAVHAAAAGVPRAGVPVVAHPATRLVLSERMARLPPLHEVGTAAGLPREVSDKNGRGPVSRPLPWFEAIRAPQGLGLTAAKITTIDANVYQDANPQSGIWYYLPARFSVGWDPDNGHAVRITYGTAVGEKQPVYLSARLTAGIDSSEVDLVRSLLRAQLQAAGVPFTELRPLPFKDSPQVSFQGELGQFDVPPEKVSVTSISDLAGEIDLSLATDPVTTAVLQTTLTEGLGLPGNLTFTAAGPEAFNRTVPVTLRTPDARSYRTLPWKRGATVRNRTPFPLVARNLHFLSLGPDGTPTVFSYALGEAVVPPQGQLRVKADGVRPWLDGALKAWIEYAVREGDEAGLAAVRDEIGIAAAQATAQVSLETLTPFASGELARLVVDVRSRYFDPKDHDPRVRTVQLSRDGERSQVGPLFLGDRSPEDPGRPGDPLYSWRVSAVKADGSLAGPGPWSDGARLELFLGKAQVQALLGAPPSP